MKKVNENKIIIKEKFTPKEVSLILWFSDRQVRRFISKWEIRAFKSWARKWTITKSGLEEYLNSKGVSLNELIEK